MTSININKLTSFLLLALSVFLVIIIGRNYYSSLLNPSKPQMYFAILVVFLLLMLLFNLMFPVYSKGLKKAKSVKLKKKHHN